MRYMTDGEICAMYRQAADPPAEIPVLAQLNAVDKKEIERILIDNGYTIGGKASRRKTLLGRELAKGGRRPPRVFTEKEKEKVIRMYRAGYSQTHMMAVLGCGYKSLRRLMAVLELDTKKRRNRNET